MQGTDSHTLFQFSSELKKRKHVRIYLISDDSCCINVLRVGLFARTSSNVVPKGLIVNEALKASCLVSFPILQPYTLRSLP